MQHKQSGPVKSTKRTQKKQVIVLRCFLIGRYVPKPPKLAAKLITGQANQESSAVLTAFLPSAL